MKTETIDNETWYYVETEAQLRSIADSDTTLAQNYIQNTNIELTSEWILLVMMNIRLMGNTTVMATPFPVFAILLVRKIYWPFGYSKGGEMYNITLISPDTTNADGAHNGAIVAICLDGGGSYDNTVLDKEPSVPEG